MAELNEIVRPALDPVRVVSGGDHFTILFDGIDRPFFFVPTGGSVHTLLDVSFEENVTDFPEVDIEADNIQVDLKSGGFNAGEINTILFYLDTIATSDFTGRIILLGSAWPDSSSGGIDGISAMNALTLKNFSFQEN